MFLIRMWHVFQFAQNIFALFAFIPRRRQKKIKQKQWKKLATTERSIISVRITIYIHYTHRLYQCKYTCYSLQRVRDHRWTGVRASAFGFQKNPKGKKRPAATLTMWVTLLFECLAIMLLSDAGNVVANSPLLCGKFAMNLVCWKWRPEKLVDEHIRTFNAMGSTHIHTFNEMSKTEWANIYGKMSTRQKGANCFKQNPM